MVASRLATAIKERRPDSGRPSNRVEQELRDIVQQAEHATEIVRTEMPGWYYCIPYPGVRYYCHEPWPSPVALVGRPRNDAPTGG